MDYQYLAGFFDGEGNINVLKIKGRFYLQLRFYNTERIVLDEIVGFLNVGKIYSRQREGANRIYELYITKREVIKKILTNLLPFLIIKKKHAQFVLDKIDLWPLTDSNFSKEEFQSFVTRKKNL